MLGRAASDPKLAGGRGIPLKYSVPEDATQIITLLCMLLRLCSANDRDCRTCDSQKKAHKEVQITPIRSRLSDHPY